MNGLKAFLTVLFVMPLAHAVTMVALQLSLNGQYLVVISCLIASVIIIYATKFIKSAAWETFAGMIVGVLLWASLVEVGVKIGAKALGITEIKAINQPGTN